MEPRQQGPQAGHEQASQSLVGVESVSSYATPEHDNAVRHERLEVAPRAEASKAVSQMPALPAPVIVQPVAQDDGSAAAVDDSSSLAADEDLIEKEWVDRAKKIINDTRDDPHAREREISILQAEYIRKRYGRIIGGQDE